MRARIRGPENEGKVNLPFPSIWCVAEGLGWVRSPIPSRKMGALGLNCFNHRGAHPARFPIKALHSFL